MYRARERVENEPWVERIDAAAEELDLGSAARSNAVDLFLSAVPDAERARAPAAAASLYAGALVAGDERSQSEVASAMDVSRVSVQSRWKDRLADAGFDVPEW
jgi:transcription initiation factor TFIIIB Brf1 subunit/transcription initiation factor TFIIB